MSQCSQEAEAKGFSGLWIPSLHFSDDDVLLASSSCDLQLLLKWFAAVGMKNQHFNFRPGLLVEKVWNALSELGTSCSSIWRSLSISWSC